VFWLIDWSTAWLGFKNCYINYLLYFFLLFGWWMICMYQMCVETVRINTVCHTWGWYQAATSAAWYNLYLRYYISVFWQMDGHMDIDWLNDWWLMVCMYQDVCRNSSVQHCLSYLVMMSKSHIGCLTNGIFSWWNWAITRAQATDISGSRSSRVNRCRD